MYILVMGQSIRRLVFFCFILVFIVPLLWYYTAMALAPGTVHYREPEGEALKVSARLEQDWQGGQPWLKILDMLGDFYQNGL